MQRVITLAGNLDHAAWTHAQRLTPLSESLSTQNLGKKTAHIPQVHWFGDQDRILKPEFFEVFLQQANRFNQVQIKHEAAFTHGCCWDQAWPRLYQASHNKSR